jgi:DNA-binding XRE family transcriptional regulator
MPRPKKNYTPGQKLWLGVYRADIYDRQAEETVIPPGASRLNRQRATRRWLEGMSRDLKERFPAGLRARREGLGMTQQALADIAELSVTAVAMIERGERAPNLDTAARLCWALDVAAGATLEDLR